MTSYALRLPDHIYEQAKAAADEDKVSINQMFVSFIAEGLGHRRALRSMRERAARANVPAALAVLDRAADVPPEAGDEILDETGSPAHSLKR
jgi:hypothetical protein